MNPKKSKSAGLLIGMLSILLVLAVSSCSRDTTPQPEGSSSEATSAPENAGDTQGGNVTVTFASYEYDRGLYEPLIEEFNQQNPSITVQFAPIPEPEPGEEMQMTNYSRLLASTGDTSLMWGSWSLGMDGGRYFRDLGALMDADPTFEPDDFWSGILSACQDAEGRVLGIPFLVNFNGIYFDPAAFDEAGLPHPAPGWTWDDFQQAVNALAWKRGDTLRYGYADQSYIYGSVLSPLVDQHLARHDGEVDAKVLQQELQWYFDLANSKAIYPLRKIEEGDWGLEWEQRQALFKGEDRPVMWTGSLMESLPGTDMVFTGDDPFAGLAIQHDGFVPFPISEDRAAGNTTPVYAVCGAMSAGTAQPRAAWAWLNFLSRHWLIRDRTQAYEFMQMPSRKSVTDEVGYWNNLPAGLEPTLRFSVEHAWFGSLYLQAFEAINQALGESLSGKTDFIAALDKAKAALASTPQPTPDTGPVVVATPPPPPPEGSRVIEYYYEYYGPGSNPIKNLIETFNQAYPDIVVKQSREYSGPPDGQDYFEYMTGKFDCLTWYTPSFEYQKPTGLLDLNALVEAEDPSFLQDFSPEQLKRYRLEGQLLGLPAFSQPQIIAYNADLLARRGLQPPDEDWTFDDFIELATKVASTTEADKSYGFLFNEWESLLLVGRGVEWAELTKDPPVAKFDTQEMIGALEWLADLAESGVILVQTDDNWGTVEQAIRSGQMAFWTAQAGNKEGWYWYGPSDQEDRPKIGVAPMPAMPESSETIYWSSENGHYITSQAEDPQACWDWIKFLSKQPSAFPGIPARRSVVESPEWEAFIGPEDAAVYRLAQERVQPVDPERSYSRTGWPFYTWRSQAVSAALKGESPKDVLSEAQRKAEAYLSCIRVFDVSELSDEELMEKVGACARQADPQGSWPP
jgi:ABC-type glycerol-3-phosphate transport system substrate-binding protein